MRSIIISIASLLLLSVITHAQHNNISSALLMIEENNTTLKALKEEQAAAKLENKTGLTLSNPEVEFNYLWGNPSNIGSRKDFSVKQSFDVPTIFGMKRDVANKQNGLIDWQYKQERINLLLRAKVLMLNLVYNNALKQELNIRYDHAQLLANAYQERLNKGEGNILESNKAQLNLSTVRGELQRVEVEQKNIHSELKRLNGGEDLLFNDELYEDSSLPISFDEWYLQAEAKNPVLQYVKAEIALNKDKIKMSKAMGLPTFSAGYMSEHVVGQDYKGISVGVSIPLWANKNRVKQAKAAVQASESKQVDAAAQFYGQLNNLYERTKGLQAVAASYQASLSNLNSSILLKKALDAGQISLLEYIVEIGLYYDTVNQKLLAERDFQIALAELQAVEL